MKGKREYRRRTKILMLRELADYYGVHRNTVLRMSKGLDLKTIDGVAAILKILEKRNDTKRRNRTDL